MRVFCKKWKNGGCFVKKWTFSQRWVHYVKYQYFLFYILLVWGVRTHRTQPIQRIRTIILKVDLKKHIRNQLINKTTMSLFNEALYIVKSSTNLYVI